MTVIMWVIALPCAQATTTELTGTVPEQPLPTFGRIRSPVTSSRQVQLGARVVFQ